MFNIPSGGFFKSNIGKCVIMWATILIVYLSIHEFTLICRHENSLFCIFRFWNSMKTTRKPGSAKVKRSFKLAATRRPSPNWRSATVTPRRLSSSKSVAWGWRRIRNDVMTCFVPILPRLVRQPRRKKIRMNRRGSNEKTPQNKRNYVLTILYNCSRPYCSYVKKKISVNIEIIGVQNILKFNARNNSGHKK